jgi:2-polyprenyl-3-methyl-5-hydroxy-6-metoxy-1,4-benzoquinol methylase
MKADFDNAATNYDSTFTNSAIGKAQREVVYSHLSKFLKNNISKTILEINCGTGEDAIWLAKQNFQIVATDISEKMILIAKNKEKLPNLTFERLNINEIGKPFGDEKFDLIFSNFGGLNCLSKEELNLFFENVSNLVSEKGHLVLVIMPKNTLWESFYFLAKAKFSLAFRRKKESVIANVDGEKVNTFYYNPKDIVNLSGNDFEIISIKPIGFFIPPSYLETFFKNKLKLLSILKNLDTAIKNCSFLSKYADHYLIVFQKK